MATLRDQIVEVRRELAVRRRVYPKWVEARKLTQAVADERVALFEAVLASLYELENRRRPSLFDPPPDA